MATKVINECSSLLVVKKFKVTMKEWLKVGILIVSAIGRDTEKRVCPHTNGGNKLTAAF